MTPTNSHLCAAILCAVCSIAFVAAGCGKRSAKDRKPAGDAKTAAAATSGAGGAASGAAGVTCASLPGAVRVGLRAKEGGKTLHYSEVVQGKNERGAPDKSLSMISLDVAARKAKVAVEKVGADAAPAPGGLVVFTRREAKDKDGTTTIQRLYAATPGKTSPARLSPEDIDVTSFAVDEASKAVVFAGGQYVPDGIYKAPLAGGQAEKIGEGREVIAVLKGQGAALVNAGLGEIARMPLAGGAATAVATEKSQQILGVSEGFVITKDKASPMPKVYASRIGGGAGSGAAGSGAAGAPSSALAIAAGARDVTAHEADDALYITSVEGEGEISAVYKVVGASATKVLAAKGVQITGASGIAGGGLAVLARSDTNGSGDFDGEDEVDVCFVERAGGEEPIALPARSAPLRLKDAETKLAALLGEPDLAGGTLRFETDVDGTDRVIIESPASGPTELAALRARVRAVQARVTELSGVPRLEVSLRFGEGARRADSSWDAETKRFLSFGGVGTALAPEPSEYKLEVDPKVKTTARPDASGRGSVGLSVCSGTVKNVGDQPIASIDVICSNKVRFLDTPAEGKGSVAPAPLAPGASGTYSVTIDVSDADSPFETVFMSGGARVPFYNSAFAGRAAEIAEVAARVLEATGLAYVSHKTERGSAGASRIVAARASKAFSEAAPEVQEARAAQASKDLGAVIGEKGEKGEKAIPIVLNVYAKAGGRLAWTYEGGKLKGATEE